MLPDNARMSSCCEAWVASRVLRFTDSCHSYAVLSGDEAVLIDFGAAAWQANSLEFSILPFEIKTFKVWF